MIPHNGVVDLRQYTLLPGRRDTLIDLFDRYFADGQESVGIHIVGQFRDLDDPDRFVWLRGFDSMTARGEALPQFYYGPIWQAHRDDANATMLDSDNALLLEPTYVSDRYPRFGATRVTGPAESVIAISVAHLGEPAADEDYDLATDIRDLLTKSGGDLVATFTTHVAENNFPALPLRDEHVLAWVTRFADDSSYARHRKELADSAEWNSAHDRLLARCNQLGLQHLRLRPTGHSRLR